MARAWLALDPLADHLGRWRWAPRDALGGSSSGRARRAGVGRRRHLRVPASALAPAAARPGRAAARLLTSGGLAGARFVRHVPSGAVRRLAAEHSRRGERA